MRSIWFLAAFCIFNTTCLAVPYGEKALGMTSNQALQVITNASSPPREIIVAMTILDPVAGDAAFWLEAANNPRLDSDRRRLCVKHFFEHFISSGMTVQDIEMITEKHKEFISYDHIKRVYRDGVPGWMPEALSKGKSGFLIPILYDQPSEYHLVIFISFEDDLTLKALTDHLMRKSNDAAIGESKIAACQTWDSDDQERRYPGSKFHPWPWN